MKKKLLASTALFTLLGLIGFVHNTNANTMAGETEIAGLSMMIHEYYYSCAVANEIVSDPEAVIRLN